MKSIIHFPIIVLLITTIPAVGQIRKGANPEELATKGGTVVEVLDHRMTPSELLLVRLFQQSTMGSVSECLDRRFQKLYASSNRSSQAMKPVNNISPPAVGLMDSCVLAVEGTVLMSW